jgi:hypothetical protein
MTKCLKTIHHQPLKIDPKQENVAGSMTTATQASNTIDRTRSERKRTPQMMRSICRLVRKGLSVQRASEIVRVHRTTIARWRAEHPDFDADVCAAEAGFIKEMTDNIREAGKTNWQASMTIMERRFPAEFSQPQVQIQMGVGGPDHIEELSVTIERAKKDPQVLKDIEDIKTLGVHRWLALQEAQRTEKPVEGREIKQIEDA